MTIKRQLKRFFDEIISEAESNPSFAERISKALNGDTISSNGENASAQKKGRRRTPAVLDPVKILDSEDETSLRSQLTALNIEQLKDIVAEFGMDQARLVMKWKDTSRIIDHIITTSIQRSTKGDAFRI